MRSFKFGKTSRTALPLMLLLLLLVTTPAHAVGTPTGTVISNTASIGYQDASTNTYTANSNTVDVTVSSVFAVSVSCAGDQSTNSNTTAYYACTLTNTGNATNTFALVAASAPGWTTALYADNGAGGGIANDGLHQAGEVTVTASTGALGADATYKFFAAVTVTSGTANGTTSVATLTVTGSGDAGAADDTTVTRTTTAQAPALTVAKKVRNVTAGGAFAASGVTAKPTEILEYQVLVTNAGTVQAISAVLSDVLNANVTYVAGSLWVGSNGAASNGAGNALKSDAAAGDAACGVDACGAANYAAGSKTVTFYLGNTASEAAGGALAPASTVYAYYRVTVN